MQPGPTPTISLESTVAETVTFFQKTPQGACSVTIRPILGPETEGHQLLCILTPPWDHLELSLWLLVGHGRLCSVPIALRVN